MEKAKEQYGTSSAVEAMAKKFKEHRATDWEMNEKIFYTECYHYIVCDPLENQSFIKNYVAGAGDSDAALLVMPVDSLDSAMEQATEHARLLWNLQVKQVAVLVNKMDKVDYKKESFDEAVAKIKVMMKGAGWPPKFLEDKLVFVPISALKGDNLLKPSGNMTWWAGQEVGPDKAQVQCMLDYFDKAVKPPRSEPDAPLRMLVNGVYKIKGVGDVIEGRVEQGTVKPKMAVMLPPTHVPGVNPCDGNVFSIEMCHKSVDEAVPGNIVALNVKGLEHTNAPRAGDVMVSQTDTELTATKKFDAQLYVLALSEEIRVGTSLTCLMRCGRAQGKVSAIKWKIAPGEGRTENPESIQGRGAACCSIELDTALVCDTRSVCEPTSRVAFMANGKPVMFGMVQMKG